MFKLVLSNHNMKFLSFDEFLILGPGGAYPPAYPPPAGQAPGYNRQDSAVSTGSSTITQEHILMSMRSGVEDAVSTQIQIQ